VPLCDMLEGKQSVAELVEARPDHAERLRLGRMLCLLDACDLARAS